MSWLSFQDNDVSDKKASLESRITVDSEARLHHDGGIVISESQTIPQANRDYRYFNSYP